MRTRRTTEGDDRKSTLKNLVGIHLTREMGDRVAPFIESGYFDTVTNILVPAIIARYDIGKVTYLDAKKTFPLLGLDFDEYMKSQDSV